MCFLRKLRRYSRGCRLTHSGRHRERRAKPQGGIA